MKAKRILSLAVALTLAMSVALTGCGKKTDPGSGSDKTGTEETKKAEQKVIINLNEEPPQMNTLLTTDVVSMNVMRHVMEGLTTLDKDSKPAPGIATEWKISDDKLQYTFTLRKDAKWSDGSNVTAKDFEFAFRQVLNKETAAPYNYLLFCIKNGPEYAEGKVGVEEVGIKATDEYTLQLTLSRPTPYLLDMLSFGVLMPVKEEFYKAAGEKYGAEADKLLYNGPWMIQEWAHENRMVLVKNPNYYDKDSIKLDEITFLMIKDNNTGLNTFLSNELDMTGIKGDQRQRVKDEGFEINHYGDGATCYFEFNTNDAIMKNANIRKALTYGVDRKTFVEKVLANDSKPAQSFTTPTIKGDYGVFQEKLGNLFPDNNVDEAKKLLEKGMQELGLTSMPKIAYLCDDSDVAKRDAQAFQEAWKKNLGLDVEIQSVPFKARVERQQKKDFQICMALWGPDYNDPMTFLDVFTTGNGNNHTSYASTDYDKLIQDALVEADATKRLDILMNTEKKLMDDMPIGPLYFRVRDYVLQPYLKGVIRDAFQDINLRWAYVEGK